VINNCISAVVGCRSCISACVDCYGSYSHARTAARSIHSSERSEYLSQGHTDGARLTFPRGNVSHLTPRKYLGISFVYPVPKYWRHICVQSSSDITGGGKSHSMSLSIAYEGAISIICIPLLALTHPTALYWWCISSTAPEIRLGKHSLTAFQIKGFWREWGWG